LQNGARKIRFQTAQISEITSGVMKELFQMAKFAGQQNRAAHSGALDN